MSYRQSSIRHRLLITLLLLIMITWVGVGLMVYDAAEHEVEEIFDASLAQTARMLLGLLQHETDEKEEDIIGEISFIMREVHPYEFKIAMRARYGGGAEALRTPGSPQFPDLMQEGLSTYQLDGEMWRVFGLSDDVTKIRVQTGYSLEVREELVGYILRRSLWSLMIGLPVLGRLSG